MQVDLHEYPKHKPSIPALDLDKAQAISKSATGTGYGWVKTISVFNSQQQVKLDTK